MAKTLLLYHDPEAKSTGYRKDDCLYTILNYQPKQYSGELLHFSNYEVASN
jgi:hypothetical protein